MALIIIGHHRSGTSLLRGLCHSHPEIVLTNEFGNFHLLDKPYNTYARFILKRWWKKQNAPLLYPPSTLGTKIKGFNLLQNFSLTAHFLFRVFRHQNGCVDVPAIEASLKDIFPQASIVGDKYPDYWFKLDQLSKIDSLKCLFIYRDPRDLASSVVKKARTEWRESWPEQLQDVRSVARRWVRLVEAMERNTKQIHVIRYEDLVTNPQCVLQGVGDWLGVEPAGFQHQSVHAGSIGKYRSGLNEQEIDSIVEIAGDTMQRLGYRV